MSGFNRIVEDILSEARLLTKNIKIIPSGEWRGYKVSIVHKHGKYAALLLWDPMSRDTMVLKNFDKFKGLKGDGFTEPVVPEQIDIPNNKIYRDNQRNLRIDLDK